MRNQPPTGRVARRADHRHPSHHVLQASRSSPPHPLTTAPRPVWIAVSDFVAISAFALLWSACALQTITRAEELTLAIALLGMLPLGYLFADAVSGLVHWFADTFFDEHAPILGRMLIQPFREHHRDALGITHHGFLEVCGNNCLVCLVPLGAAWPLFAGQGAIGAGGVFGAVLLLSFSFFVFATNGFHRWAHVPEPPRWVAWLQRHRLILSPASHALHHEGAHDKAYCVTSGWLNPLLDRVRFFERATRLGAKLVHTPDSGNETQPHGPR